MSMLSGADALSVAFRAGSFVLLLNAAGIPIFIAVFGRLVPGSLHAITKLGWRLAIAALVFVVGHHALEAARMAGEMAGVMDPAMQVMTLRSPEGAAFALRVLGLVLVATGLRPGALAIGIAGAVLCVTAFTLTGHTSVTPYRPAAAALLTLHQQRAAACRYTGDRRFLTDSSLGSASDPAGGRRSHRAPGPKLGCLQATLRATAADESNPVRRPDGVGDLE
jgi:hypothetical protein